VIEADPDNYFSDNRDYKTDVMAFWKIMVKSPPHTHELPP